jgi:S-adenosyl-L-methionine hydrolase (adenosine-forming)
MTVVTFTTDFGTADGYVGAMKGVVLSLAPDALLVDITHDVPAYDVTAGAFALAQAAPWFPAGSIHVAVIDPGVGHARADLVVEAHGALFVGPDNGVLSLAARGPRVAHRIAAPGFRREPVSPTFHGRDVFATAAGRLAAGTAAREAGPLLPAILDLITFSPADGKGGDEGQAGESLVGTILHVDRFGNLITSIDGDRLSAGLWRLGAGENRPAGGLFAPAARTYADVERGAPVFYVGSSGLVEIALREGSAAEFTGLARGAAVTLEKTP